ncbi:MAG: hypothetical protein LIO53_02205 [Oscillospiraceae bacterium]|nr:hypothetical protein [Oscillospiraceae bacterium]
MVNDDGTSDPRELIIDKGRAFIPQGENVILPLSKGAKVYTSEQTKALMSSIGIPRYASGTNNSDAFTAAKDDWTHYTKTHAVTTSEELGKWVEFSEQFKDNKKDIADIEEQLFSLRQKITQELNNQSEAYIEERAALNDWDEYGDSALKAFERVSERNKEEVNAGRMTWEDYADTMEDIGQTLYDSRIEQSQDWLDHEEKYNGMSADDYLAGIDRMRAYTQEYYDKGIITHREYLESMAELDDAYIDKRKEQIEELYDTSSEYISEHTYFNDWGDISDSPLAAYARVRDRNLEALENGELTQEEYDEYMSSLGATMLDERMEQSMDWLDEQRKYFGMSDEEYVEGLERIKKYVQEYYDNGLISRQEYNEAMTELNHEMWDEAADAYETMLENQKEYISDLQDQFSAQEQALQDSWDVEDRAADIDDVAEQLAIYENAVTDAGQQKYKELLEEMKDLQREEELYNLQVENNAVIEDLEAEYEQLESQKADVIAAIASNTDIDVSSIVGSLTAQVSDAGNSIASLLSQMLEALSNLSVETNSYTDSRQVVLNAADNVDITAILTERVGL